MNRSKFQIGQRVTTAVLLVLIGFITTCVGQTSDEWQRYKVKGEEFSVALPALPAMKSREVYILSLRRNLILGSKTEGIEVEDGIGAQPVLENVTDQDPSPDITGMNVNRRIVVVTKPEPSYTESARQAHTKGTVILKLVFTANGGVTNFRVVQGLPNGLTERSISAAKQMRFVPAVKNGQFVSMWMQVEYNFNLY
jgi:TonB family protein